MGWLRQETAYERKMRELDEEAERIRKNMQTLMKANHTRDSSVRVSSPAGLRKRSSVHPAQAYDAIPESESEVDDMPDLEESVETDPGDSLQEKTLGFGGIGSTSPRPERLASYLASGSFGKGGSLSRERRIQRNKAIFMMVVAVIAIFSLYTWLK